MVLVEALAYITYVWIRYYFSLVCAFKEPIKKVEVKVDVQKGALGFRGKFDRRCASSIYFTSLSNVVICIVLDGYLVHSCWGLHLGFRLLQIGGS